MPNVVEWEVWDPDAKSPYGFVKNAKGAWRKQSADLDEMDLPERVDLFRELVKKHDFYYAMSDDHRVWLAGEASIKRIVKVGQTICKDLANEIWEHRFGDYQLFTPLFR